MNERIQQLSEQANKQIRHRICPNTFKPIDDPNGPHIRIEFDKEKFAELIVRECINIAYEYDKPKLSGPGLAIASNIESHFDIYIEEDGRFVK